MRAADVTVSWLPTDPEGSDCRTIAETFSPLTPFLDTPNQIPYNRRQTPQGACQ